MSNSSLLWSIHPPEGKTSYLFGTMHIRDERVYGYCDVLYPIIQQSDVYVGEMDLGETPGHIMTPAYSMSAYFRPEVYAKLRCQVLKSFRLDILRFDHLHPLMIMSAISQSMLENDRRVSLDEHLWHFADRQQLTMQGLETLEEQVTLLHSIAPEPLYRQIKEISTGPEKLRKFTRHSLELYAEGDIHRLYQLTKSSMHHLRKRIIYNRNLEMIKRMKSFDPSLTYFVAVGAGHLSGSTGIIGGLRASGYKVKPMAPFSM